MKTAHVLLVGAALGLAAVGGIATVVTAQDNKMGGAMMEGMDHSQSSGDDGPSSLAFGAANDKMHGAMAIVYTGEADVDFVRSMIPHHQGAIDMAKIVIAFGTDPEIRKLAGEIVKAQEGEIALMQAWLKKKGQN